MSCDWRDRFWRGCRNSDICIVLSGRRWGEDSGMAGEEAAAALRKVIKGKTISRLMWRVWMEGWLVGRGGGAQWSGG